MRRDAGEAKWSESISIALGAEPPRAFRIFAAGWNKATKGRVLFDAQAAAETIGAYAEHGVDKMIDLEHLSLNEESRAFDPDARGWLKLELRGPADAPELWAVDVTWTPDGERRLREKTQRYVSPAFRFDPETKRVLRVTNVAITAMPATFDAMPLVAASVRTRTEEWKMAEGKLTAENLPAVLAAFELPPDTSIADVMAMFRAIAMADAGEPQPTEGTPAEPPAELAEAPAGPPVDEEDEDKGAAMAATARLVRLTGKATFSASLDEVETWRQSHLELSAGRARLKLEQEKLEAAERRTLTAELVKLGAETPATAWSDSAGSKPCRRLAQEPLVELRTRVGMLSAARGGKPQSAPRAPTGEVMTLSEVDADLCRKFGTDPKLVAAIRTKGA